MSDYRVSTERIDAIDDMIGKPELGVRMVNIACHIVWHHKQLAGNCINRIETHRPQTTRARLWRMILGG